MADRRLWFFPRYFPKSSPSLCPRKNPRMRPHDSYKPAAWIKDTLFMSLELQFGQIITSTHDHCVRTVSKVLEERATYQRAVANATTFVAASAERRELRARWGRQPIRNP